MTDQEPTIEEKINYIYDRMKKQQKVENFALIIKWGTRLLIVLSILYFFFIKLPALKDDIIDGLKPDIPSFNTEDISNSEFLNSIKQRFMGEDAENSDTADVENNIETNY